MRWWSKHTEIILDNEAITISNKDIDYIVAVSEGSNTMHVDISHKAGQWIAFSSYELAESTQVNLGFQLDKDSEAQVIEKQINLTKSKNQDGK